MTRALFPEYLQKRVLGFQWRVHGHRLVLLYRAKAARAAPANMPRPAVAMAAPPVEAELEPEAPLELEAPLEPEAPLELDEPPVVVGDMVEPVSVVSVEVLVLVESVVAAVPVLALTDEVKVLLPLTLTTGEVRPAGMEAAGCWEVTTVG